MKKNDILYCIKHEEYKGRQPAFQVKVEEVLDIEYALVWVDKVKKIKVKLEHFRPNNKEERAMILIAYEIINIAKRYGTELPQEAIIDINKVCCWITYGTPF